LKRRAFSTGLFKRRFVPAADAALARYRARFEPFELGIFETRELAKAAVEKKATELINTLLATVLPAELKAWLRHT
jgi:hypothetical protein